MKILLLAATLALAVGSARAQTPTDDPNFEPVHPQTLVKLLPGAAKGFSAGKPEARMSGELGSKITIVSRVYTKKPDEGWFSDEEEDEKEPRPTLTIKITDSTATRSFTDLHNKLASMGQSETSGYSNAMSVDGHLAIQNYRDKDQVGVLSLYVADRFLVQIAIKGLEKDAMMDWWEKIHDEKLAALAIPPTPTPVPTASHTPASSS